jgi:hypothetical protein
LKVDSAIEKLGADVKETALETQCQFSGIVSAKAVDSFPSLWVGWETQQYTKKRQKLCRREVGRFAHAREPFLLKFKNLALHITNYGSEISPIEGDC